MYKKLKVQITHNCNQLKHNRNQYSLTRTRHNNTEACIFTSVVVTNT